MISQSSLKETRAVYTHAAAARISLARKFPNREEKKFLPLFLSSRVVGPSTRPSTKSKRRARKHAAMSQKGQEKHKHVPNTLTHKMYPNISAFILSPVLSKTLFARSKTFRSPAFFSLKPRFSTSRRVSSKDAPVAKVKRTRWKRAREREIH